MPDMSLDDSALIRQFHDLIDGFEAAELLHRISGSAFFLARVSGQDPYFLKTLHGPKGFAEAGYLFSAMKHYSDHMAATGRYTVPKPVSFEKLNATDGLLVMEYIRLRRGDLWFKWFASVPALRRVGVTQAAQWIVRFHQAGQISFKAIDTDHILTDLMTHNIYFEEHEANLDRVIGRDTLNRLAHEISRQPIQAPVSGLHGDFTPSNIFLAREKAVGFDFDASTIGPAYEDLATFIVSLTWSSRPFARPYSPRSVEKDIDIFIATYKSFGIELDRRTTYLYLVLACLKRSRRLHRKMRNRKGRAVSSSQHLRILRKLMSYLLDNLRPNEAVIT